MKLSTRPPVTLSNTPCEDAAGNTDTDCRGYYLIADLPTRHAYFVLVAHYEGADFWLIDDRTGRRTTVPAVPQFSPDSREFLTIDNDVAYGGDFDLQIWKRSGDRFVEEWSHRASAAVSEELISWSSRDRLSLRFSVTELSGKGPVRSFGALLRHGKGWRLEMRLPPEVKDRDLSSAP